MPVPMERDALRESDFIDTTMDACVRATGVRRTTAIKVLRWFLDYPEPLCDGCSDDNEGRSRCLFHQGVR